jgi:hypothetical protein
MLKTLLLKTSLLETSLVEAGVGMVVEAVGEESWEASLDSEVGAPFACAEESELPSQEATLFASISNEVNKKIESAPKKSCRILAAFDTFGAAGPTFNAISNSATFAATSKASNSHISRSNAMLYSQEAKFSFDSGKKR